jgi:uncharacterized protein
VSPHRLDPAQQRVLGCLIEKQRTTPDQYPLSLNALRLACNQSSNRDPVLDLDDGQVREAVQRLSQLGWARLASGPGSRAAKYRHLLEEALGLDRAELSVLALLLLRGPQTTAELKARTERLHRFDSGDEVAAVLERLDERDLAHLLPRRPGQREERWTHLLGDGPIADGAEDGGQAPPESLQRRVERLEARLDELERALAERGVLD